MQISGWLRLPGKYPWWVFNNVRTHRPKSCLAGRPQKKVHSRDGAEAFLPDLSLGLLSCQGQEDQCLLGRLRMRTGTSCRSHSISLWDATTGQRDGPICVGMSPGIQPDSPLQCSNRERARAQPVPELESQEESRDYPRELSSSEKAFVSTLAQTLHNRSLNRYSKQQLMPPEWVYCCSNSQYS